MSYRSKIFLLASVLLLVLCAVGGRDVTIAQSDSFANHHKELHFTLPPGQSPTFQLPSKNQPVQVSVSTSNVIVSFNGSTIPIGPLVLGVVASFDSAAGIANINFNGTCTGQDTCLVESAYDFSDPNNSRNSGIALLTLIIDKHTGNISLGVRAVIRDIIGTPVPITNGEINYAVTMNY
ncbi:MAG TPA: hypothetical protein VN345_12125 [Blastocatellia bacterium]|nr:hypothetical protein [Blastocatellia bacterium]